MNFIEKTINLQDIKGSNDKKDFIRKNTGDFFFMSLLMFSLNTFKTTGLSLRKIGKPVVKANPKQFIDLFDAINYVCDNNTGTDEVVGNIQNFIDNSNESIDKDFLRAVFTKDLKLGVTAKTFNACVPEIYKVPVFDVMLAESYYDNMHRPLGRFVITQKLDGMRILAIIQNDKVNFFSRQGNPIEGLGEIEKELRQFIEKTGIKNVVFDGELLSSTDSFTDTLKEARTKKKNKVDLVFNVFDALPLADFKQGIGKFNAVNRKNALSRFFKEHLQDAKFIKEVKPLYIGEDVIMVDKLLEEITSQGGEGLILNMDTPYECRRTKNLLKVKKFKTCDVRIIGFEQGGGKYLDMLGAVIVDYKGNPCGVGTGLTEEQRHEIWNNKEKYLNRILEVKYFEESECKGIKSMRFPVFIRIREDGKEVSYN